MPHLLRMPEVAANTAVAVLAGWPVPVGGEFRASDPIATVETDKAVVDVEADSDGVLVATLVPEGASVAIGDPIALLAGPGENVADLDAALSTLGAAELQATNGRVHRIFASPLARRLAREAGISVDELTGTGPNSRIVRRDVEAAIARRAEPAGGSPDTAAPAPAVAAPIGAADARFADQPHTRIRRAIAARLLESKQTAPHFYLRATARVDALLRMREELNDTLTMRVSMTDLLVKAVAQAHLRVPEMNVIWTPDAVRSFTEVDVAVAVATEHGLVTPVLRSVESQSITVVARSMHDLVARARSGGLHQRELEGGSMTVTNLGMYGTEEFAAIINPPQSAILAVGAVRQEPVARDGRLAIESVMRLTLSVDHRPVDGVIAARWLQAFQAILERPVQILG